VQKVLQLLTEAFRYVVVDTASGLDEYTLAALEYATDLIVLSATDIPSIRSTQKEIDALRVLGRPEQRWHFVLNRADAKTGLTIGAIETAVGVSVDVAIPSSRAVPLSLNHGTPVIENDPRAPVSLAMAQLVRRMAPQLNGNGNGDAKASAFWRRGK
jgi:pilus assembly protein CpaE